MKDRRYRGYRGRGRASTGLKVFIVLLLVVLVAAVGALFWLEPYVVYSADGVRIELPFFHKREAEPQNPAPVAVATPEVTPTPVPVQETSFRGFLLPDSALSDGTAAGQLEAAGANAAIFDMKGDDGSLAYVSDLPIAIEAQVSAADPGLNETIRQFNEGDVYTVARVSCFRDDTVPRGRMDLAIKTSAGNWRDTWDHRWLSLANEEARAYVIGVCRELAELGFDELLLDNCAFPTQGRLDWIVENDNYRADALTEDLTAFFQELSAALADWPELKISVVSTSSALAGEDDKSGQTADLLAGQADRVLIRAEEGTGLPALGEVPVVPILAQPGGADGIWAAMDLGTG